MKKCFYILMAAVAVLACKKGEENITYEVVTVGAEVSGKNITLSGKLGPDINEEEVTAVGFFVSEDKKIPESGSKDFGASLQKEFQKKVTLTDLDGKSATTFYYRAYAKSDSKTWLGQIKAFATEKIPVTKVEVTPSVLGMSVKEKVKLAATVTPADASLPKVTWTSSNSKIASVSESGEVTGVAKGKCEIIAEADGKTGKCSVTVRGVCPDGAVDMGTSVFWATCNLGASAADEVGDYFCWGETAPKDVYSTSTYNNACDTYGFSENLKPADDAAHVILKGNWRMPTKDEFLELIEACDKEFITIAPKAKEVVKFTSKTTKKTLVFRVSYDVGVKHDSGTYWSDGYGMYWTATNHSVSSRVPYHAQLYYEKYFVDDASVAAIGKHYGLQIRPVSD